MRLKLSRALRSFKSGAHTGDTPDYRRANSLDDGALRSFPNVGGGVERTRTEPILRVDREQSLNHAPWCAHEPTESPSVSGRTLELTSSLPLLPEDIILNIVDLAPWEVLVRLRTVSQSLRDHIDAKYPFHVRVTNEGHAYGARWVVVRNALTGCEIVRVWLQENTDGELIDDDGERVDEYGRLVDYQGKLINRYDDYETWGEPPPEEQQIGAVEPLSLEPSVVGLLAYAQIVDFVGDGRQFHYPWALGQHLSNVHTVRYAGTFSGYGPHCMDVPKVVVRVRPPGSDGLPHTNSEISNSHDPGHLSRLGGRVQEVIFDIGLDADDLVATHTQFRGFTVDTRDHYRDAAYNPYSKPHVPGAHPRHVTLVFSKLPSSALSKRRLKRSNQHSSRYFQSMIDHTITLVDSHQHVRWFNLQPALLLGLGRKDVEERIRRRIRDIQSKSVSAQPVSGCLEFFDHSEYRAQLDSCDLYLHTHSP